MGDQKIPDRSDFSKKFAAVESFLREKIRPRSEPVAEKITNSQPVEEKAHVISQELKCSKCGTEYGAEDVFCGTCGNKLKDQ